MAEPTGRGPAAEQVLLVAVGDTHGDFAPLFEAARREPAARAILQVGDLTAGKPGREQRPDDDPATLARLPLPLVWVHGNHEHWHLLGFAQRSPKSEARSPKSADGADTGGADRDRVKTSDFRPQTTLAYHLWPGDDYVVPGTHVRVVGLPGNFAPTWYGQHKPFPGDRVRHFNAADVTTLERFERPSVLLMHEAFRGQAPGRIGQMGIPILAQLVRRLRPQVCLTGHHHTFAVTERGPTLAIALPRAQVGYVRLYFAPDGPFLRWELVRFGVEPPIPQPQPSRPYTLRVPEKGPRP